MKNLLNKAYQSLTVRHAWYEMTVDFGTRKGNVYAVKLPVGHGGQPNINLLDPEGTVPLWIDSHKSTGWSVSYLKSAVQSCTFEHCTAPKFRALRNR